VTVELVRFFGGHPQFLVHAIPNNLYFKLLRVLVVHFELGHESGEWCTLRIPPLRDLLGIREIEHGIKDRLLG
jgi:hypothetical protein